MYATTGLRRNEVLSLHNDDIDLKEKSVMPKNKANQTKHSWISFFNEETKEVLNKYLATRKDTNSKLFPLARENAKKIWKQTRIKTKIDITPQVLREWFAARARSTESF